MAGSSLPAAHPLKVALLLHRRFRDPGLERTLRRACVASSLDLQLLAGHAAPVMSDMGYLVDPTLPLGLCPADLDLLVVPGAPLEAAEPARDPALVRWLSSRAAQLQRWVGIGQGVLLLGQAGLLEGRWVASQGDADAWLVRLGARPVMREVVIDGPVLTATDECVGSRRLVERLDDFLSGRVHQPQAGTPTTFPSAIPPSGDLR
jgi:transcriptional regulator GlxA family with amidase domain